MAKEDEQNDTCESKLGEELALHPGWTVRKKAGLFVLYGKLKICGENIVNSLANVLFDGLLSLKLAQTPIGQTRMNYSLLKRNKNEMMASRPS